MIRSSLILGLLTLAVAAPVSTRAATRYRHVTIRAAAQLCQGVRVDRQYPIAVSGFFRPGPENHGPDPISGGLFDSDRVPRDAGLHIRRYHGILFGTRLGLKYRGSISGIVQPHARVSVSGVLSCAPGSLPSLMPDVITVTGEKPVR